MHPCHQGVNPLVQTFPAQGDGFLKIQVPWRAPVCWPRIWEKLLPSSARTGLSLGNWGVGGISGMGAEAPVWVSLGWALAVAGAG